MFANAGMVQFKDVFTGQGDARPTRARPRARSASASAASTTTSRTSASPRATTRSSRCSATSPSATTSRRTPSPSRGSCSPKVLRVPNRRACDHRLRRRRGRSPPTTRRARSGSKVTGFGDERILGLGMKDNFWQMGDTGPCGPCTEIHCFNGDAPDGVPYGTLRRGADARRPRAGRRSGTSSSCSSSGVDDGRRGDARRRCPSPASTPGMGLERVASVLQGVTSNYDTDLLRALVDKASEIGGKRYRGTPGRRRRLDARHRRPRAHDGVPHRRGRLPRPRGPRVRPAPRDAPGHPPRAPARHRASRSSTRWRSRSSR